MNNNSKEEEKIPNIQQQKLNRENKDQDIAEIVYVPMNAGAILDKDDKRILKTGGISSCIPLVFRDAKNGFRALYHIMYTENYQAKLAEDMQIAFNAFCKESKSKPDKVKCDIFVFNNLAKDLFNEEQEYLLDYEKDCILYKKSILDFYSDKSQKYKNNFQLHQFDFTKVKASNFTLFPDGQYKISIDKRGCSELCIINEIGNPENKAFQKGKIKNIWNYYEEKYITLQKNKWKNLIKRQDAYPLLDSIYYNEKNRKNYGFPPLLVRTLNDQEVDLLTVKKINKIATKKFQKKVIEINKQKNQDQNSEKIPLVSGSKNIYKTRPIGNKYIKVLENKESYQNRIMEKKSHLNEVKNQYSEFYQTF